MTKQHDLRNELKGKPTTELARMLTEAREELRDLRFRVTANQHKDVRELRELRQRVARIMTILKAPKAKKA